MKYHKQVMQGDPHLLLWTNQPDVVHTKPLPLRMLDQLGRGRMELGVVPTIVTYNFFLKTSHVFTHLSVCACP